LSGLYQLIIYREEIYTMKCYVKPTVEVVALSVKETIADLPEAVTSTSTIDYKGEKVTLTTYNLAAVQTSDEA